MSHRGTDKAKDKIYHGWLFHEKSSGKVIVQLENASGRGHRNTKFDDNEEGSKLAADFVSVRLNTVDWHLEEQPIKAIGYRIFTWKEATNG